MTELAVFLPRPEVLHLSKGLHIPSVVKFTVFMELKQFEGKALSPLALMFVLLETMRTLPTEIYIPLHRTMAENIGIYAQVSTGDKQFADKVSACYAEIFSQPATDLGDKELS